MKSEAENNQAPLRPHEVDGIVESDNPLPRWWVGLFVICIIFAGIYMVLYHVMGEPDHLEDYVAAVEAREARQLAQETAVSQSGGNLDSRIKNPDWIEQGLTHYTSTCSPCHGAQGEGGIGPNLTDNFWLHGGSPQDIVTVLEKGVLTKGMPAWKDILGKKKIEQVTALIVSWQGKNLAGKAPQGEPYNE